MIFSKLAAVRLFLLGVALPMVLSAALPQTSSPENRPPLLPREDDDDDDGKSGKKLSGGAIAGIVIGVIAFVALLSASTCCLRFKLKRKKRSNSQDEKNVGENSLPGNLRAADGPQTSHG